MPVRTWAREKKLELSIGREIDYEQIRTAVIEENKQFDIKGIGFDAWGSKYLAETLVNDGVPLMTYRMAIATFGPGCQLFQNLWNGKKFIIHDDPIMRRAMSECIAKRDLHGNIRPCKARNNCIIDPLVAAIMAVHSWGGQTQSTYESDEFIQGNQ
jgi:phage terminase large subunit-like protein